MTKNLGSFDRALRVLLGIILLVIPFIGGLTIFDSNVAMLVSVVAGIVMLATSAMRFCPLYRIFGIRTCKL